MYIYVYVYIYTYIFGSFFLCFYIHVCLIISSLSVAGSQGWFCSISCFVLHLAESIVSVCPSLRCTFWLPMAEGEGRLSVYRRLSLTPLLRMAGSQQLPSRMSICSLLPCRIGRAAECCAPVYPGSSTDFLTQFHKSKKGGGWMVRKR